MKSLRRNTDSYVTVGSALDKTAGFGNEDALTVTSFSGVWVKESQASATTHTAFTPDATASNDWGMVAVGHGGAYQLKIPDAEIDYVGTASLFIWYDAESLPFQHEFEILPADMWDSKYAVINQKVDVVKISGDSDAADNLEDVFDDATSVGNIKAMFDGTGYAGGTAKLTVDVTKISGDADAANNLELACDNYSATRGLTGTALPAAAANAAGGVPVSTAGGLDLDAKLANTNEITAARMGALTDWINGGRLDILLDSLVAAIITNAAGDDVAADIIALKAVADAITAAVITNAAGADVSADVIALKTVADAIKVITDQITFTTIGANKRINSTVKAVVSTELTGDGSTTPWGPA